MTGRTLANLLAALVALTGAASIRLRPAMPQGPTARTLPPSCWAKRARQQRPIPTRRAFPISIRKRRATCRIFRAIPTRSRRAKPQRRDDQHADADHPRQHGQSRKVRAERDRGRDRPQPRHQRDAARLHERHGISGSQGSLRSAAAWFGVGGALYRDLQYGHTDRSVDQANARYRSSPGQPAAAVSLPLRPGAA